MKKKLIPLVLLGLFTLAAFASVGFYFSQPKGPSVRLEEYSKSVSAEEAQKVFDVIATSEVHSEWKFILNDLEK